MYIEISIGYELVKVIAIEYIRLAQENYRDLPGSNRIDNCADCVECIVKCVNELNLNENIQRARELFV